MELDSRLRTTLEVKLDVIKEYYDSANQVACALWTYVLTFKPYLPHGLLEVASPSIRITGIDNGYYDKALSTLEDVMRNTGDSLLLNMTYKDNSIIVTGSGDLEQIRFGALTPSTIRGVTVKAKCQGIEYKWRVPDLDPTSVDTLTQAMELMAYPTFIHE